MEIWVVSSNLKNKTASYLTIKKKKWAYSGLFRKHRTAVWDKQNRFMAKTGKSGDGRRGMLFYPGKGGSG